MVEVADTPQSLRSLRDKKRRAAKLADDAEADRQRQVESLRELYANASVEKMQKLAQQEGGPPRADNYAAERTRWEYEQIKEDLARKSGLARLTFIIAFLASFGGNFLATSLDHLIRGQFHAAAFVELGVALVLLSVAVLLFFGYFPRPMESSKAESSSAAD